MFLRYINVYYHAQSKFIPLTSIYSRDFLNVKHCMWKYLGKYELYSGYIYKKMRLIDKLTNKNTK
mgnify:CR=1 FL=1